MSETSGASKGDIPDLPCSRPRRLENEECPLCISEMIHGVQPFGKVQKRIANGESDSLVFFFDEFVPAIVEGRAPSEWKAGERKVEPGKPWWKVW